MLAATAHFYSQLITQLCIDAGVPRSHDKSLQRLDLRSFRPFLPRLRRLPVALRLRHRPVDLLVALRVEVAICCVDLLLLAGVRPHLFTTLLPSRTAATIEDLNTILHALRLGDRAARPTFRVDLLLLAGVRPHLFTTLLPRRTAATIQDLNTILHALRLGDRAARPTFCVDLLLLAGVRPHLFTTLLTHRTTATIED